MVINTIEAYDFGMIYPKIKGDGFAFFVEDNGKYYPCFAEKKAWNNPRNSDKKTLDGLVLANVRMEILNKVMPAIKDILERGGTLKRIINNKIFINYYCGI